MPVLRILPLLRPWPYARWATDLRLSLIYIKIGDIGVILGKATDAFLGYSMNVYLIYFKEWTNIYRVEQHLMVSGDLRRGFPSQSESTFSCSFHNSYWNYSPPRGT
jgi:hypothetical protein